MHPASASKQTNRQFVSERKGAMGDAERRMNGIRGMEWIATRLNRKFLLGTFSGLLLVSLIFLLLFLGMYREQLERIRGDGAIQVTRLLQVSLEQAMLLRNLDMLETIVAQLSRLEGVSGVSIINRTGEIRFSSVPDKKGGVLELGCGDCAFDPARSLDAFSFFLEDESGARILRNVNPVHNMPACKECHGLAELNPINGTLVVDLDAEPIKAYARETALILVGAGALAVLATLLGGWWFIQHFVISPVQRLSETSGRLGRGDLAARVHIGGRDELYRLGRVFNGMAEGLQSSLRELREKEDFLQGLVDAIPDGIRVIDRDFNIVLANRAYREQLGLGDRSHVGTPCYRSSHGQADPCVPTLVTCPLHEIGRERRALKTVHRHKRADGKRLAVEIYAAPLQLANGGDLVVESIRDLDKVVHYNHERKLAEIGQLAAGVAHEIHNPLASIRIAVDALTRKQKRGQMEVPAQIEGFLELVDEQIRQCIDITERLLKLSMFAGARPHLVDINRAATDMLSLLSWEAEENNIRTQEHLDPSVPTVMANEGDLRMIVLNLLQNAFHAMPEGGDLRVTTRADEAGVELEIADTGVGIPSDVQQFIFDPFFSRRADGVEGTGLGLSIVLALIKRCGGRIEVDSELGRGSTLTVIFPASQERGDSGEG
jgi:PAS domain S-box-containing protein